MKHFFIHKGVAAIILAGISLNAYGWFDGREGGNGGDSSFTYAKNRGGVIPNNGPSGIICWALKSGQAQPILFDQRSNLKVGDPPPKTFNTSIGNLNFTASILDIAPMTEQISVQVEDTDSGNVASSLQIKKVEVIDLAHVESLYSVAQVQMENRRTGDVIRFVCEIVNGLITNPNP